MAKLKFSNPFRPGAGHMPPYLAGRDAETKEFQRLLEQDTILENLILTGLRGLGKTVLLETFKPLAMKGGWLWAGADLSESTSISEENLAVRLLTDLSVATAGITIAIDQRPEGVGFARQKERVDVRLDFSTLIQRFNASPGLTIDKLKAALEFAWPYIQKSGKHGIVFAYDEAQNLADHAGKDQYPLSMLLDLFQSIQRKNIPYMLALTGLPTLFPKLVEARTYAERMFRVVILSPLTKAESIDAMRKPIRQHDCPISFADESVEVIYQVTRGYPYFIQFVCREAFDVWSQATDGQRVETIPIESILRKLDTDFFAGRWAKATDRQRELLKLIARLPNGDAEFSVQDIVECANNRQSEKPFGSSQVNQMLSTLSESGLIYKNRHGRYALAVPLLCDFIRRLVSAD